MLRCLVKRLEQNVRSPALTTSYSICSRHALNDLSCVHKLRRVAADKPVESRQTNKPRLEPTGNGRIRGSSSWLVSVRLQSAILISSLHESNYVFSWRAARKVSTDLPIIVPTMYPRSDTGQMPRFTRPYLALQYFTSPLPWYLIFIGDLLKPAKYIRAASFGLLTFPWLLYYLV